MGVHVREHDDGMLESLGRVDGLDRHRIHPGARVDLVGASVLDAAFDESDEVTSCQRRRAVDGLDRRQEYVGVGPVVVVPGEYTLSGPTDRLQ